MKKLKSSIAFKDNKVFILVLGIVEAILSVLILGTNLFNILVFALDYFCLIAFCLIYSSLLNELKHKEASLKFFDTLLFHLRWGSSFTMAVEQANALLESQNIEIDPTNEFTDIECRKLSLGTLTSAFSDMLSDFKTHKPLVSKASIIKSKIWIEIEQIKVSNDNLASYNNVVLSKLVVQFLTLGIVYLYNSYLSINLESELILFIGLALLIFDLLIVFLLTYYRKEII